MDILVSPEGLFSMDVVSELVNTEIVLRFLKNLWTANVSDIKLLATNGNRIQF